MMATDHAMLDARAMEHARRVLREASGLALRGALSRGFETAFLAAARDLSLEPAQLAARIQRGDDRCIEALVERALIRETYFFRHPEQLARLTRLVSELDRPARIWCAGCASGEEPWSLAIALREAGRAGRDTILATDLSAIALAQAAAGIYGDWSFRRVDPALRVRHFERESTRWRLDERLRLDVTFRRHNLVREVAPATDLDVVLCRNVLIYFEAEQLGRALATLDAALAPGGLLITSPAEVSIVQAALDYERDERDGVVMLRKPARARPTSSHARAIAPPPIPAGPTRSPESAHLAHLRAALEAEDRGDLEAAISQLGRALILEPRLPLAHAWLSAFHRRRGCRAEAAQARRDALQLLEGIEDDAALEGGEGLTAGSLRKALQNDG